MMIILRTKNVDTLGLEMSLSFCLYLLWSLVVIHLDVDKTEHNAMGVGVVLQDPPSQVGENNTHMTTVPDRISLAMQVGLLSCMQVQCTIACLCLT